MYEKNRYTLLYITEVISELEKNDDEEITLKSLNSVVNHLKKDGYSNTEILNFFQDSLMLEAQSNDVTLKNNESYIEKVKKILGE